MSICKIYKYTNITNIYDIIIYWYWIKNIYNEKEKIKFIKNMK